MGIREAVFALTTAGCLLGNKPNPPTCAKGFHVDLGRCVRDDTTESRVTIAAAAGGTSCTGDASSQRPPVIQPDVLHVKVDEDFQFDNQDVVAHEIRGTDGTAWITVGAGQLSPFTSIKKVGTWGYRASGCVKGATIAVDP